MALIIRDRKFLSASITENVKMYFKSRKDISEPEQTKIFNYAEVAENSHVTDISSKVIPLPSILIFL